MIALLTAALGYVALRYVRGEFSKVTQAAKLIGEGHLEVPIQTHRTDELGDLARSFLEMQQRLRTDRLTGLVNREALMRRLELGVAELRANPDLPPLAVLFIDLNHFKQINDRFGHDVGDAVLIEISQRLTENIRGRDLVARYAGDEFVVLLPSVKDDSAAEIVRRRFEHALHQPLETIQALSPEDALRFSKGGAVGMALCPNEALTAQELLKLADLDMYQRKDRAAD